MGIVLKIHFWWHSRADCRHGYTI